MVFFIMHAILTRDYKATKANNEGLKVFKDISRILVTFSVSKLIWDCDQQIVVIGF